MISSGMSPLARWTCSAWGRTFSSANRWKVSRTSSKSSSRWRGPALPPRRPGRRGRGRRPRSRRPGARAPASAPSRPPGPPAGRRGRPARRPRRRRPCAASTVAVGAVGEGGPGGGGRRPRRGPGRRRPPGWRRCRRRPARAAVARRRRPRPARCHGGRGRLEVGGAASGMGHGPEVTLAGPLGLCPPADHGDQRRQDDGVVAGVDVGQRAQVVGHRSGPDAGRRLGPGVDDRRGRRRATSAGRRAPTSGCRAPGIDSGDAADPTGRGDRLLGHHPAAGPHGGGHAAAATTAGSTTCMSRNRQKARSTGSGRTQVLAGLGDGEHLAVGGGRRGPPRPGRRGSLSTA